MTVRTKIVRIGNSRGVRLPKSFILASELGPEVELQVKRGEIRILPINPVKRQGVETTLASERSLASDWSRPEENAAWQQFKTASKRVLSPSAIRAEIRAYRQTHRP